MIELEADHRSLMMDNAGGGGRGGGRGKGRGRGQGEQLRVPPVKLVVGNKSDLSAFGRRQVGSQEGWAWAKSRGCGFMECSARDMVNIEETFALLVKRVVESRQAHYQRQSSPYHISANAGFSPISKSRTPPLPVLSSPLRAAAGTFGEKKGMNGDGGNRTDMIHQESSFEDTKEEKRRKRRKGVWDWFRCW